MMPKTIDFEQLEQALKKANRDLDRFDEIASQIFEIKDLSALEKNMNSSKNL